MAQSTTSPGASSFSQDERDAMKHKIAEEKAAKAARRSGKKLDGETDLRARVAQMTGLDRQIAERRHAIVMAAAPASAPKTWYGMSAYAGSDGKVLCYFAPAAKFKTRYASLGFNDDAQLDGGHMWPVTYALTMLDEVEEQAIAALLKKGYWRGLTSRVNQRRAGRRQRQFIGRTRRVQRALTSSFRHSLRSSLAV